MVYAGESGGTSRNGMSGVPRSAAARTTRHTPMVVGHVTRASHSRTAIPVSTASPSATTTPNRAGARSDAKSGMRW